MSDPAELEAKFWKSLKSERTCMLGLVGEGEGHSQPMTAQMADDEAGPVYFFTSNETDLVRDLGGRGKAMAQFVAKDHKLFACVEGELIADNDRTMIDKLWSPFVAAWFEGGKDDPKLQLLRFEPMDGRVWENENSLLAGVKLLLGRDPKQSYQEKVTDIRPH
jgi:general stress protein 26